eukprot:73291-Pyramimonas_sp.AAC.1
MTENLAFMNVTSKIETARNNTEIDIASAASDAMIINRTWSSARVICRGMTSGGTNKSDAIIRIDAEDG